MFIDKLEIVLKERKSNISQLSKATGLTQQTMSNWKKGAQPQADKIKIICEYLNISADYLLEIQPREPDILSSDEKLLLEEFRKIEDDVGKEIVLEVTKREASRYAPPGEKSSNLKIG